MCECFQPAVSSTFREKGPVPIWSLGFFSRIRHDEQLSFHQFEQLISMFISCEYRFYPTAASAVLGPQIEKKGLTEIIHGSTASHYN